MGKKKAELRLVKKKLAQDPGGNRCAEEGIMSRQVAKYEIYRSLREIEKTQEERG